MKKIALVTGGARGIGRGIACSLARANVAVAIGFNQSVLDAERLVHEINSEGGRAIKVNIDASQRLSVVNAKHFINDVLGEVNILVNNAGISQEKLFLSIDDEDWDRMLSVNLKSAFITTQEFLPAMINAGWGRIINIGSIGGQWGGVNQVHYAVSKAGMIGLTRSIAKVYSKNGVTTNCVAPGLVLTEMSASEIASEAGIEKIKGIPIGRIATIDEVASVVAYLASDASSYVTGQTIGVNGGMYFG